MLADINVTPFVDILLIVLIAFIISAPLITRSLPIELPQGHLRHGMSMQVRYTQV